MRISAVAFVTVCMAFEAMAAQKPKTVKGTNKREPTFVRYTPANQMGETGKKNDRIIKIVERQEDLAAEEHGTEKHQQNDPEDRQHLPGHRLIPAPERRGPPADAVRCG